MGAVGTQKFWTMLRMFLQENDGAMCANCSAGIWEVSVVWDDGKSYGKGRDFNEALRNAWENIA